MVDAGAAGAAVIELMRKQGLAVKEFIITNDRKAQIVTDLVVGFEQRKLLMPSSGRTLDESRAVRDLEGELHNFEPTVLRSGNLRYEAGSGYHDDLVMALCLAYSGASYIQQKPIFEVIELGPFVRGGDTREGNFTWHRIS